MVREQVKKGEAILLAFLSILNIIFTALPVRAANEEITYYPFREHYIKTGLYSIVIDPGHDGTHAGAHYGGMKEEDLTLKIGLYIRDELKNYPQLEIHMTRDSAACPNGGSSGADNARRVSYAASVSADLYFSVHLNASSASSANGAEVYYQNENHNKEVSDKGKSLSKRVLSNLSALGIKKNGIFIRNSENGTHYKTAEGGDDGIADYYSVLKNSKEYGITGVIVEHCYISSPNDRASFLNTDEKLRALAHADAMAILDEYNISNDNYRGAFFAKYYYDNNPDVAAVYGSDPESLLYHFLKYGILEGRAASPAFDVLYYKNNNPDLYAAFGEDNLSYLYHFIFNGMREGRVASELFDINEYIKKNPDLYEKYGDDLKGYYIHYSELGYYENRDASADYEPEEVLYRESYDPDLIYVYRLYNNITGEHYYTVSKDESESLRKDMHWIYEGDAFLLPKESENAIFKMISPSNGEHHFALTEEERDDLIEKTWEYGGVAFYSPSDEAEGSCPVFRLYNPNAKTGFHHYTKSEEERDFLTDLGWIYEGVSWYSF